LSIEAHDLTPSGKLTGRVFWYNRFGQGGCNNMATGYKSGLVKIYHSLGRKKRLGTVIFFVTSVCNAKCRTCFYWEELNQHGDLTWDEIRKLALSMPPFGANSPTSSISFTPTMASVG
jgi:sulfatase maturation enzyme AslB (radical SAM superfamily)